MKLRFIGAFIVMATALVLCGAEHDVKRSVEHRVTDVSAFVPTDQVIVRVVLAEFARGDRKASEYFLTLTPTKDGVVHVFLKHESHPADEGSWRGDACGRCLITEFDLSTGRLAPFRGFR